jgi:dTDP-4-amino-4,6-dideoxygalactose transaminase
VASANPILYEKAIPVFIDSEAESWNMSPVHLEAAFKAYPKVKAVLIVHLYGTPALMDEIVKLFKQYKVTLIEDAAESLGSTYRGRHMGTFGDYGILSFNGNKIITAAGGGMVLSNNQKAIEQIRFWSTQARDNSLHYEHSQLGYNYRMSSLSAAVGRGQLKVLDLRVQQRRSIHQFYKQALADIPSIKIMAVDRDQVVSNAWLTCIQLDQSALVMPLLAYLETQGIETRPLWKPMHLQPLYHSYAFVGNRTSDRLYHHGLCLPSDSKLTQEDLNFISYSIKPFSTGILN